MNRIMILIKREYWENRGSFFKAPTIFGGFILVIAICYLILLCMHVVHYKINGQINLVANIPADLTPDVFFGIAMPFLILTWLVAFYYFLHCLYDDRKDRSILFWQSMPIANWETVLSKVISGIIILPLCVWACIVVTEFIFLIIMTIAAASMGLGSIGNLWEPMMLLSAWLHILAVLYLQALWLLPLFGWCVFCSAFAKKSPFLTAVIPYLLIVIIESIFFGHSYIGSYVISRFGMATKTWGDLLTNTRHEQYVSSHHGFLNQLFFNHHYGFVSIYWSLIIGAALMAGAIYLRYTNFRTDS